MHVFSNIKSFIYPIQNYSPHLIKIFADIRSQNENKCKFKARHECNARITAHMNYELHIAQTRVINYFYAFGKKKAWTCTFSD